MFVTINYISCRNEYTERFESLMSSRIRAIDTMPGFIRMEVLKPTEKNGDYLIISHWESEDNFRLWKESPQFLEGHKRGFADMTQAKKEGHVTPMRSDFKTYILLTQ
jgi:heme oxygenase (mycobilin-producing)